jgi:hypothetical protein
MVKFAVVVGWNEVPAKNGLGRFGTTDPVQSQCKGDDEVLEKFYNNNSPYSYTHMNQIETELRFIML